FKLGSGRSLGSRVDDEVAYLAMPSMGSGHQPTLNAFADSLQGLIARLDTEKTTGWILDLRSNDGGNCWPMLAGVGPLLGEGVCGYFQDPDGSHAEAWSYQDGKSYQGMAERVSTRGYRLFNPSAKVAILIGRSTASSGEVTATAFIGHPRARSFGQPTAGYATTNTTCSMSDGAMIILTVSVYGDRNKKPVEESIIPDELVQLEEGEDTALAAALRWLKAR
ncbi:MAG: S41 family peptidase, partial [Bacteroidota bacterium]